MRLSILLTFLNPQLAPLPSRPFSILHPLFLPSVSGLATSRDFCGGRQTSSCSARDRPPFALKSGAPESPPNAERKKTKKVRPPRPSIRRCGQQQQHRIAEVNPLFPAPEFFLHLPPPPSFLGREGGGSLLFPTCNRRRYLFQLAPTQNVTDMTSHGAGYRGKRGDENVLEPPSLRLKQSEVKT